MSAPEDIIVLLLNLLTANWNDADTLDITPQFRTGWIDPQGGTHQVIIAGTPNETAMGATGIYGIESGGGHHQLINGITFIECYAEVGSGLPDPKEASYLFCREVQRIIQANVRSIAGYDYISYLGASCIHPSHVGNQDHPAWIRYSCRIGYMWRNVVT